VWRVLLAASIAMLAVAPLAAQQVRDTSRSTVDTSGPRPERRPPLSPRRAFVYSLFLPGYAQSVLGRGRAGTLILGFEAAAIIMIRQSAADVREARRNAIDSLPVSFVDATGAPKIRFERSAFPTSLIRSRRAHVEDWIAVLLANHLFAAADGYVASLLWDLPAEVAVRGTSRWAELALRLYW
jgi:hypothetical protein